MPSEYLVRMIRMNPSDLDKFCRAVKGRTLSDETILAKARDLLLGFRKTSSFDEVNPVSVYHTPSNSADELSHALGVFAFVIGQPAVMEPLQDKVPGRVYATLLIDVAALDALGVGIAHTPSDCTTFHPTVAFGNHRDLLHDPRDKQREGELLALLVAAMEMPGMVITLPLRPAAGAATSFKAQTKSVVDHCRREFLLLSEHRHDAPGYDAAKWIDSRDLDAPEQVKRTRHLAAQLDYDWGGV